MRDADDHVSLPREGRSQVVVAPHAPHAAMREHDQRVAVVTDGRRSRHVDLVRSDAADIRLVGAWKEHDRIHRLLLDGVDHLKLLGAYAFDNAGAGIGTPEKDEAQRGQQSEKHIAWIQEK
ncbi:MULTISPECIES: hypothetical protein [Ensifer]|uniref:hypothetical protein n=1 Tax=Ensifer TaxID=106591 RepID=UPI001FCCFF00|nr:MULTISPECIES: hypothetical protein [Ensifer]